MKKIVTLYLLFLSFGLFSQPVLTSAYFPKSGDILRTNIARNPDITISAPGPNQVWDFSRVNGRNVLTSEYKPADQAQAYQDYQDADIFLPIPPSFERFFASDTKMFNEIGFTSLDPIVQLLSFNVRYNEPYTLYRAPLKYEDVSRQETSFFTTFPFDTLPDTIVNQVPPTFRPDTISVRVFIKRSDKVDAWGTLHLPSNSYSVLRQKNIEIRRTRIFAYSPVLGWSDATDIIKGFFSGLPVEPDTSITYSFFSETNSGPVAVIQVDSIGGVASLTYGGWATATKNPGGQTSITAKPNPTYGKVNFTFDNLTPGRYHLEILNILGKPVWDNYYNINSTHKVIKENYFFLPKGTYLYSLSDSQNRVLTIKKLIVLKP